MIRSIYTTLCCLLLPILLLAQTSKDATVAITANLTLNPAKIALSWPNATASTVSLKRRKKGESGNLWTTLINTTNSTTNTYEDTNIGLGDTYEYSLRLTANNITAYGFAHVAVMTPVVHSRGRILVFIDSTTADAVGIELKIFKDAMRGDGWQPKPFKTGPSTTVQWVKNQIMAEYNIDPSGIKAILLIGDVPVPYSGNTAWDGHPEHNGAWPSDAYYADINGVWSDNTINNTTAARDANKNIPGDGKFDQSILPSAAELMIGRIDFRRLDAATFGATPTELIKRYLLKNARWRTKQYTVDEKAIVDDNFGYFGGEAFAANGYRNAYPLVGESNVFAGDILSDNGSYLYGYGTGAGSYNSAAGVGNSTNFAQDSINIVFTNIFGSYHGDWDYETNPLMPSVLASKGGVLTCGWAGRPHWFMQGLASGEPVGYCVKETMNASYNNQYNFSIGTGGAHVSLLGDPTLRAKMVAPPAALSSVVTCSNVHLNWQSSPDTAVLGYYIYRATQLDGPYSLASPNAISGNSWIDNAPLNDTVFYQVRAVRLDQTPGGGLFYNNSIGPIERVIFQSMPGPDAAITSSGIGITCAHPTEVLSALVDNPNPNAQFTFSWLSPSGLVLGNGNSISVNMPGVYTLQVFDSLGCFTLVSTNVLSNNAAPVVSFSPIVLSCAQPTAVFQLPLVPAHFTYSFLGIVYQPGQTIPLATPGVYDIVVTNTLNGCTSNAPLTVEQDANIPSVIILAPTTVLTCQNPMITLTAEANINPALAVFAWTGVFIDPLNPVVTQPGTYCIIVTNITNGCTATDCIEITQEPNTIAGSAVVTPASNTISLDGAIIFTPTSPSVYQFEWSNGATTASIVGVAAGTYMLTVTDQLNQCTTVFTYIVDALSGVNHLPNGVSSILILPNPAHDRVQATVVLAQSGTISGELYNSAGKLVKLLPAQTGTDLVWEQDISLLPNGFYWLLLCSENGCFGRKIIVAHHE